MVLDIILRNNTGGFNIVLSDEIPSSPTPSVTPSLSISSTPSVSISATRTPSITPSLSISATPSLSISATRTPSLTPSLSISLTPSLSISATRTPSLTPSLSISSSPGVPTPSTTPTRSISLSPSIIPSRTPSLTPSPSEGAIYSNWVVKYSTTTVPNTVKNKNMVFGNHGDAQWGPTAVTGFWNGIDAPTGGYTIYYLTLTRQEPIIYVAYNDTECINLAKFFGGSSITTINDAVTYFSVTNPDTNIFDENGLIT